MNWNRIINSYNDDTLNIESMFGDEETFFKVIGKKGLLGELDPEKNENRLLLAYFEFDREQFIKNVLNCLTNVIFENDKFYFVTYNREDLAELFRYGGRNYDFQALAKRMLSEDSDYDFYDYYPENIFMEVIEELDSSNIKKLESIIIKELDGKMIEPETELLETLSSSDENGGGVVVNSENISDIINDEETITYLLNNELQDIKSNLSQLYNSAYNNAYHKELWEEMWSELQHYFVGQGDWELEQNKKNYFFKIEIADFMGEILDFLRTNANYSSPTLCYEGSYIFVLNEINEGLKLYPPDYANGQLVDEYINSEFDSYL
jgi:hypothetical protein